ncbi:MAG: hypothetical protein AB7O28_00690 [Vicinamibacterales bacterium]
MLRLDRALIAALAVGLWSGVAVAAAALHGGLAGARFWFAGLAALAAVAVSARGAWAATGRWTAVAIGGSAAALTLIQAGPPVRYQHALDWPRLADHPVALAVLALQAALVAGGWATGGRFARLSRGVGTAFGWGRAAMFVVAAVLLGATLSRDVWVYVRELVTATVLTVLQAGTIGLAGLAAPARVALTDVGHDREPALGVFEWAAAGVVVVTCLALNLVVYQNHPHVPDEVQYLFQARYFAEGRLAIDVPPVPRAFETYLTTASPQGWYSVVPPGWPAVLALGAVVGAELLVNPLLSGLNVLLMAILLQAWYGRRVRQTGVALLVASPWALFLGMSFMPQTATLSLALLAAVGVERARRTGASVWAWLAGAALGGLAFVRQLDALIAALALGLSAIGIGGRRLRVASTAGLVLGSMAVGALLLAYNAHFTGRGTRFPIMEYNDRYYAPGANDYGFGPNRGMGWALDPRPGHDLIDGLINTNLNLTATQVELFGWGAGSLAFALVHLLRGRFERADTALTGTAAIVWAAYFANYFSGGPDFGARYWYLALPSLLALTARGIHTFDTVTGLAERKGTVMAVVACAVAVLTFVPWRATDKYFRFRGMRPDIRELAETRGFGRALVVVNGLNAPDYASASTYNPLDWSAAVPIYAWNRDATTIADLRAAFPDRPIWIVDGPSRTGGGGYRVVAGPIAPGAPLPFQPRPADPDQSPAKVSQ